MTTMINALLLGTVVLGFWTLDAVYLGVDSKVIVIGSSIGSAETQPKFHRIGDVVFLHVGLFKDAKGKLDVVAAAESAISTGGPLDAVVDRFANEVSAQLLAVAPDLKAMNPQYYNGRVLNKRPIEVLFASARSGIPTLIVVSLNLVESGSTLEIRADRIRCPGDCPAGGAAIGLGEHDVADRSLDAGIRAGEAPLLAIRKAIEAQAAATPNYVATPAHLLTVKRDGEIVEEGHGP
jgi:hypothetical protein